MRVKLIWTQVTKGNNLFDKLGGTQISHIKMPQALKLYWIKLIPCEVAFQGLLKFHNKISNIGKPSVLILS
nr:hypothetical transcript [Hymenolepis microstoma]